MKSYRELVYSIIEFVSGFQVTDDNPLDEVIVGKKVDDVRAMLIQQEWTAHKKVNDLFYQQMDVSIENEGVDPEEEIELRQFFVRFNELLPNVAWANIKYLGKKNMREKYNRRSLDEFSFAEYRRWSAGHVDYTVIGPDRALVRNEKLATDIIVVALFKSPLDVPGMTWDSMYPVPDPFRLEMIVKQDILAGLGVKADEKNDARHNQEELTGGR